MQFHTARVCASATPVQPESPAALELGGESLVPPSVRARGATLSLPEILERYPCRARIYRTLTGHFSGEVPISASRVAGAFRMLRALNRLDQYVVDSAGGMEKYLRPHQSTALEECSRRLERDERCGYLLHVASSGKTVIFYKLLEVTGLRALVTEPSKDLVRQNMRAMLSLNASLDIGRLGRAKSGAPNQITFTTDSQLLSRWSRNAIDPYDFDILVVDESHVLLGAKRRAMTEALKPHINVLGFTGTDRYYANKKLENLLGPPWHVFTLVEAVEQRMSAPFVVEIAVTEADISKVKVIGKKFDDRALAKAIELQSTIEGGIELYQSRFSGMSAIVPCGTVQSAKRWAESFNAAGIPAAALYGDLKPTERHRILDQARSGAIKVLTGRELVVTGIDVPRAKLLFNAVPTLSALRAEQRFARVTRLDPENPEAVATVVEFLPRRISRRNPPILVPDLIEGRVSFGTHYGTAAGERSSPRSSKLPRISGLKVHVRPEEVLDVLRKRDDRSGFWRHLGGRLIPLGEQQRHMVGLASIERRAFEHLARAPRFAAFIVSEYSRDPKCCTAATAAMAERFAERFSRRPRSPAEEARLRHDFHEFVVSRRPLNILAGGVLPRVVQLIARPRLPDREEKRAPIDRCSRRRALKLREISEEFTHLRNYLAEKFLPLAEGLADDGIRSGAERDERRGVATVALIDAIHDFPRLSAGRLETVLARRVTGALESDAAERRLCALRNAPAEMTNARRETQSARSDGFAHAAFFEAAVTDDVALATAILDRFGTETAAFLQLCLDGEHTFGQVGREFRVSQTTVSNKLSKNLRKATRIYYNEVSRERRPEPEYPPYCFADDNVGAEIGPLLRALWLDFDALTPSNRFALAAHQSLIRSTAEKLPERWAQAIEQRLLTSRGVQSEPERSSLADFRLSLKLLSYRLQYDRALEQQGRDTLEFDPAWSPAFLHALIDSGVRFSLNSVERSQSNYPELPPCSRLFVDRDRAALWRALVAVSSPERVARLREEVRFHGPPDERGARWLATQTPRMLFYFHSSLVRVPRESFLGERSGQPYVTIEDLQRLVVVFAEFVKLDASLQSRGELCSRIDKMNSFRTDEARGVADFYYHRLTSPDLI